MTHILVRPKVQLLTLISSCIASVRVEVERPKHFSYKLRRSQSRRDSKMASSLRLRGLNLVNTRRTAFTSLTRWFSSADALVEIKPGEIGMVSGIPEQHLRRRVIIYSPARTATQQGSGKVGRWQINFVSTQKWENPLMGWTSTGDPYANVGEAALKFDSQEAAIEFAEKYGWEYSVKKRHTPLLKVKAYADNFKWKGPASSQG